MDPSGAHGPPGRTGTAPGALDPTPAFGSSCRRIRLAPRGGGHSRGRADRTHTTPPPDPPQVVSTSGDRFAYASTLAVYIYNNEDQQLQKVRAPSRAQRELSNLSDMQPDRAGGWNADPLVPFFNRSPDISRTPSPRSRGTRGIPTSSRWRPTTTTSTSSTSPRTNP